MKSPINYYAVCDTETGGLLSKTKQAVFDVALTEIAFVIVNNEAEIVDKASWLIKPYSEDAEYGAVAAQVSGISKQMCEEQGTDIYQACNEIIAFLKKYRVGKNLPIVVGHNFQDFDTPFVQNLFEFCEQDICKSLKPIKSSYVATEGLSKLCNNYSKKDEELVVNLVAILDKVQKIEVIDTLTECRKIWPESANYKLGTCCGRMGVELIDAHRALPDTISTAKLWGKILKNMRGVGSSEQGGPTLERYRDKFEM